MNNPRSSCFLITVSLLFLAGTHKSYAQDNYSAIQDLVKVHFLRPGISVEKSTTRNQSLLISAYLDPGMMLSFSDAMGWNSKFWISPSLGTQYRFYYNQDKRFEKGKRTDLNNLNYLAPLFETQFTRRNLRSDDLEHDKVRPVSTAGIVWGMQRNYNSRISLDIQAGPGFRFAKAIEPGVFGIQQINYAKPVLIARVGLGIWLGKKGNITRE